MKNKTKLLISILSIGMLLSSCSGIKHDYSTSNHEEDESTSISEEKIHSILSRWNPTVSVTEDSSLNPTFDEMDIVPEEKRAVMSTSLLDTPRGSNLYMTLIDQGEEDREKEYNAILARNSQTDNLINVTDADGITQDVALYTDGRSIVLPFNSTFEYGAVYIISLDKSANLIFKDKDPSIQRLTVEIEDDPSEAEEIHEQSVKDNIPVLSLDKVSEEEVDDNALYSFIYDGNIPSLVQGDTFVVKKNNNDEELDITDFYGEFDHQEDLGGGKTKVYYVEPDLSNVYTSLRQKDVEPMDLSKIKVLLTEDVLVNSLRYSSTIRGLLSFISKNAKTEDEMILGSIMDALKIDFDYNYYDNKLTFSFSIAASNIELIDDALYMTLKYKYEKVTFYNMDFDVGLKKKWFVPVGVSYKIKCVEEVTESHSFAVIFEYTIPQKEKTEEELKDDLESEIDNAKAGEKNFYDEILTSEEAASQTQGNKTTIPLFELPIPIYGAVMFEIRIDFIIDISVQAMFLVKKQWKSNRVVFNFSNKSGGESDSHQDVEECSTWDFYFMGMAEVTLTLRLSGAIYIKGTYKYLHAEVYAEFYIKIGVQGALMASFASDTKGESFSGNISIDLYVLMGARIGLELVIAIFDFDFSRDLFKTYILRLYYSNELEHYSDDAATSIVMNQTVLNIDDTDILKFRVWDGVKMIMDTKKLPASSETLLIESWLGNLSFRSFSFEVPSQYQSLLEISEDGIIHIKDGTEADFNASFIVHVSNMAGFVADRSISLEFHAADAHHIYIDDVDMGRYRPGVTYKLPLPPEREGYRFLDYSIGESHVPVGEVITMGNEDIYVTSNWHKIIYYTVMYYDGKNNLIYIDTHVEEHTKASEPTPEIRDQYMNGYFFLGWDKAITNVNSNLVVHGIYMRVGD